MTVAGFTMISESCHLPQNRDSNAHSPRSALVTVTTLPKPAERTSLVLHSELADPVADAKGSHYRSKSGGQEGQKHARHMRLSFGRPATASLTPSFQRC
jgi:hypothetical protein